MKGQFRQSKESEAVDSSINNCSMLFKMNDILITQEEVDKKDDERRKKFRVKTREHIRRIKELSVKNSNIRTIINELESIFERNNKEEDFYEFVDDMARAMNIRSSEKIILDTRLLNKTLEEIHLEHQKMEKSCDCNHNS